MMANGRPLRLILAAVVVTLLVPVVSVDESNAYPQDPNNCNDNNISYSLWNSGKTYSVPWYTWQVARMNETFGELSQHKGQNGQRLLTLTNKGLNQSAEVKVYLLDTPSSTYGSSNCAPLAQATMWVNDNWAWDQKFLWKTGAHEMLHLGGAEHGGRYDSWYGLSPQWQTPTRTSTCTNQSLNYNSASASFDDIAYLNWLHGSPGNRQLMADSGFETGIDPAWIFYNGLSHFFHGPGSYEGSRHVRINPTMNSHVTSASHFVQQNVTLLNGDDNEQYRGTVRMREHIGSYVSSGVVEAWYRTVTFDGNNNCPYADGLGSTNPNDQTPTLGTWVRARMTSPEPLTTSYRFVDTSWFNPPGAHAYHLAVRARGQSKSGSTWGWLYLDNLTMEGT